MLQLVLQIPTLIFLIRILIADTQVTKHEILSQCCSYIYFTLFNTCSFTPLLEFKCAYNWWGKYFFSCFEFSDWMMIGDFPMTEMIVIFECDNVNFKLVAVVLGNENTLTNWGTFHLVCVSHSSSSWTNDTLSLYCVE